METTVITDTAVVPAAPTTMSKVLAHPVTKGVATSLGYVTALAIGWFARDAINRYRLVRANRATTAASTHASQPSASDYTQS